MKTSKECFESTLTYISKFPQITQIEEYINDAVKNGRFSTRITTDLKDFPMDEVIIYLRHEGYETDLDIRTGLLTISWKEGDCQW